MYSCPDHVVVNLTHSHEYVYAYINKTGIHYKCIWSSGNCQRSSNCTYVNWQTISKIKLNNIEKHHVFNR